MTGLRLAIALAALLAAGASASAFEISSSSVSDGKWDKKYIGDSIGGCDGQSVSPALAWKDVPDGAKSLALTLYDPDAPSGSGWWHWQVWNIPVATTGFDEGQVPKGVAQGKGDIGRKGYFGPCPPAGSGMHHYTFTIYALKVPRLKVKRGASPATIGAAILANTLAKASVVYTYQQ